MQVLRVQCVMHEQDAYLHVRGTTQASTTSKRYVGECRAEARNLVHITRIANWNGVDCERCDRVVIGGLRRVWGTGDGQNRFMHTKCIPTHFDASHTWTIDL